MGNVNNCCDERGEKEQDQKGYERPTQFNLEIHNYPIQQTKKSISKYYNGKLN